MSRYLRERHADKKKIINPGDIYITRDGHELLITLLPDDADHGCQGCYYYQPPDINCHSQPACKWWTRPDHLNIIYKQIT